MAIYGLITVLGRVILWSVHIHNCITNVEALNTG